MSSKSDDSVAYSCLSGITKSRPDCSPAAVRFWNVRTMALIALAVNGYNARFTATHRAVSVYRVLQMRGGGYADVLPVLQVPDNKADAVPCERLLFF
ncbi:MAG: hypothetical protein JRF43_02905 [Deltaproteobacteria bacterium]|nr:hypothetical protein [Deltaproteobacteria bacterium]